MINTYDMRIALRDYEEAQDSARLAEDARQYAWADYLRARDRANDAQERLHDAEREVTREAGRLAGGAARPNRDERRAQVYAGLGGALRDLPF